MFKDYLAEKLKKKNKFYYNFNGISRKDFPKWPGWKLINQFKENGVDINTIDDKRIDILVENFHYLQYIKEKYF